MTGRNFRKTPARVSGTHSTDKGKVERFVPVAREPFRRLAALHVDAPLRELNEHARHWCRHERTDSLETIFAAFMARTEEAIGRLERIIERREQEGARERKEMNERWGNVANKMGTLVEDIVAPSIRRLAREVFDCGEQRYFGTRVSVNRSDDLSREREFDALYVGARAVLLNETKASPRTEYVQAFGGVSWRAASSRSTTRSTGRCR